MSWWKRLVGIPSKRVLDLACVVALVALVLISWSMVDPRPIPVILAMSVGQVLGTLSFAAFLVVVVRDLRRAQLNDVSSERGSPAERPAPGEPSAPSPPAP